jgi:predicted lipid carrier protein YhbT
LPVATVEECREALANLARRLDEHADQLRDKLDFDRTLACRVSDLETAFHGRLLQGRLIELNDGDNPEASIALNTNSDDLIALLEGRLDLPRAVASRRLSISASPFDLLKLRKML